MKQKKRTKQYQINTSDYLSQSEQASLLEVLKKYPCRDTLVIELLLKTGARASEVLMIEPKHLNREDSTVLIQGLKGSDDREIPLSKDLFSRLSLACSRGIPFDIGYSRLQAIWYHYRPVKKKLHSLRHTFAVNIYSQTKDLLLVQTALGHRAISSTMVYAKHLSVKNDLRKLAL